MVVRVQINYPVVRERIHFILVLDLIQLSTTPQELIKSQSILSSSQILKLLVKAEDRFCNLKIQMTSSGR